MKTPILITAVSSALFMSTTAWASEHYYRFEPGAEAANEVGDVDLADTPATTDELGSIPAEIPQTGADNTQAADGPAQTAPIPGVVTDQQSLTVEAMFVAPEPGTTSQFPLVTQWNLGENSVFRFLLQPAGDGADGETLNGETHRLVLVMRQRDGLVIRPNSDRNGANADDLTLVPGKAYYAAVVFDNAADEITFFVRDLETSELRSKTTPQQFGRWEQDVDTPLNIGTSSLDAPDLNAVIDEVRVTPRALTESELLISDAE
ncbi:MAG: LamG-like jellyroll fold domain-containing protein [Planctomycetota bacterium]